MVVEVELALDCNRVTAVDTEIAVCVPSEISSIEFENPINEGRLLTKLVTDTFLLIGVPVGSSTTWSKSAPAIPVERSVKAVIFLSAIWLLLVYLNPQNYGNVTVGII